jgi:hypothetical protein
MPTDITDHVTAGFPAFGAEAIIGPIVDERPIPEDLAHVVRRIPMSVQRTAYTPPALNTALAGAATFYFVGDVDHQTQLGDQLTFTRLYSNIPTARFDYETFAATFPGIGYSGAANREPFQRPVTSQLHQEYYLVGTGGSHASADLIPVVDATSFRNFGDTTDRDAGDIYLITSTTPAAADWITEVGDADFTYVVAASTVRRYLGNIYVRTTRRVRPL